MLVQSANYPKGEMYAMQEKLEIKLMMNNIEY